MQGAIGRQELFICFPENQNNLFSGKTYPPPWISNGRPLICMYTDDVPDLNTVQFLAAPCGCVNYTVVFSGPICSRHQCLLHV